MAIPDLDLEHVNVTVLGDFNPAIFHPTWFSSQGYKLPGLDNGIQVVSPQISELIVGSVTFSCLRDRMTVATSNIAYAETVLDLTSFIFSKLPHTPVRACGIKFGVCVCFLKIG
jgi:hypothetical protein